MDVRNYEIYFECCDERVRYPVQQDTEYISYFQAFMYYLLWHLHLIIHASVEFHGLPKILYIQCCLQAGNLLHLLVVCLQVFM